METVSFLLMWAGSIIFLIAFALNSYGIISAERNRSYHVMNILGAIALGAHFLIGKEIPLIVLESVWGTVALSALVKMLRTPAVPVALANRPLGDFDFDRDAILALAYEGVTTVGGLIGKTERELVAASKIDGPMVAGIAKVLGDLGLNLRK